MRDDGTSSAEQAHPDYRAIDTILGGIEESKRLVLSDAGLQHPAGKTLFVDALNRLWITSREVDRDGTVAYALMRVQTEIVDAFQHKYEAVAAAAGEPFDIEENPPCASTSAIPATTDATARQTTPGTTSAGTIHLTEPRTSPESRAT